MEQVQARKVENCRQIHSVEKAVESVPTNSQPCVFKVDIEVGSLQHEED